MTTLKKDLEKREKDPINIGATNQIIDEYKHQIVWVNKVDLTPKKLLDIILEIDTIKKMWGTCFILTKDLSKEELEKLFGGEK